MKGADMHSYTVLKWFRFHCYAFLISPDCHLSNKATSTLHVAGGWIEGQQDGERSAVWTQVREKAADFAPAPLETLAIPSHHIECVRQCLSVSLRPSESRCNWSHALFHAVNKSHSAAGMNYEKQGKTIDERAKNGRKGKRAIQKRKAERIQMTIGFQRRTPAMTQHYLFSPGRAQPKNEGGRKVSLCCLWIVCQRLFSFHTSCPCCSLAVTVWFTCALLELRPFTLSFVAATLPCLGFPW